MENPLIFLNLVPSSRQRQKRTKREERSRFLLIGIGQATPKLDESLHHNCYPNDDFT